MYYWKYWYDTRRSILAYLAAVAIGSILWLLPHTGRSTAPTPGDEARLVIAWSYICAWILAIAFGAAGPGADIGEGLGAFLLTRPRSRAYFMWVGWVAGLVEVVALLGLTVGVMTAVERDRQWHRVVPGAVGLQAE